MSVTYEITKEALEAAIAELEIIMNSTRSAGVRFHVADVAQRLRAEMEGRER